MLHCYWESGVDDVGAAGGWWPCNTFRIVLAAQSDAWRLASLTLVTEIVTKYRRTPPCRLGLSAYENARGDVSSSFERFGIWSAMTKWYLSTRDEAPRPMPNPLAQNLGKVKWDFYSWVNCTISLYYSTFRLTYRRYEIKLIVKTIQFDIYGTGTVLTYKSIVQNIKKLDLFKRWIFG